MSIATLEQRIVDVYATSRQVRDAAPLAVVSEAVRQPGKRLAQIVATVMEGYADRPAVGQRAVEFTIDAETGRRRVVLEPRFETITYRELWAQAQAVAAAWYVDRVHPVRPGEVVATLGFGSKDYTTVDLACIHLGAVCLPLQSSAPAAQLKAILDEAAPRVIAASANRLHVAVECLLAGASPEMLVVFDYHHEDDDQREALESARKRLADAGRSVVVESLDSVVARGLELPTAPQFDSADEDRLALLIYTSGSTGTPKGVMYTERMVGHMWRGWSERPDTRVEVATLALNYLPLSHLAGRTVLAGTLGYGGTAYFPPAGDLSTFVDDMSLVRPTRLVFVPRVCELLMQRYQSEVSLRSVGDADPAAVEQAVKEEVRRDLVGGRLIAALCGAAPLTADMKAFMESVLGIELHNGYGSTETGVGVLVDNQIRRSLVIDHKLVDVPELGYFRTDKPYPRGELLVKTHAMFRGYFNRPDATAQVFDEEGFYRTGDIMAQVGPDRFVFVDRRNNVLKLSQGEFVAVTRLEGVFADSPLIRNIFVYGRSDWSALLAVIVPANDAGAGNGIVGRQLKAVIRDSLHEVAKEAGLQPYEIPRDFLIETEPFSSRNGLLSGVGKPQRSKLIERYGDRLGQLYRELADDHASELVTLRRDAADQSVLETVGRAAQVVLGGPSTDPRPDAHFADLGGDSLAALSFATLLNRIFDVDVPVARIVSPTNDLQKIAMYIDEQRKSGSARRSAESVHGRGPHIRAADLTLDKFIDSATLSGAGSSVPRPAEVAHTVLLTGGNGYLGRFLCLEWMRRLDATDGTVICIVRGRDADEARARLEAVYDSGDPELLHHFRDLASRRLEVIAGDVGDSYLGVDEATWNRLADSVDLIIHAAALVNHVLPYTELFGPNVVGTAEIIRLAITRRLKPVSFLSTGAVAAQIDPSIIDEDGDIRVTTPARKIDGSYANGYGYSKWASEVLLREAHDLCGLPVAVFRSELILAHRRYTGQLNVPDVLTRLILSLVATGIAPGSFYETDSDGHRRRGHYDGLPADFVAEAITTLGARANEGFTTFNVVNPHDDGVSLDAFVDWLIDAGNPIHRIDDYDEWLTRFEKALSGLPDPQRQHSALPLMQYFEHPAKALGGSAFPAERFRAAVQEAKIGPDNDIPHVTRSLIDKYIGDLDERGLLAPG